MSRTTRHARRLVLALVLAALAATVLPAIAGAVLVTVRVEGQERNLQVATSVTLGSSRENARAFRREQEREIQRCAADTAYQALELAVRGNWDRQLFVTTISGESHRWEPNQEQWIIYDDDNAYEQWHYDEWGLCELHLREGAKLLLQAGKSGLEELFIPHSVPLELQRITPASGPIEVRSTLTVHVTKWRPTDIFGREDRRGHWIIEQSPPTDAVGYTVSGGGTSAVTDARGNATLRFESARRDTISASMLGSALDWSRTAAQDICIENRSRRC